MSPKKYAVLFDTLCRSLPERRRQLSSAPSIIQLQLGLLFRLRMAPLLGAALPIKEIACSHVKRVGWGVPKQDKWVGKNNSRVGGALFGHLLSTLINIYPLSAGLSAATISRGKQF